MASMKKALLGLLVAVNVLAAAGLVSAVDFLGGLEKGLLLSRIYELRHQGIIESDSGREIALGFFGVADVQLPEGDSEAAGGFGADFVAAVQSGEASLLFRKIHSLPGCMARWAALLLCTNGLVFLGGWLLARRQGRGRPSSEKGRAFWDALSAGVLPILAGADLLAGAAYVPLLRMVARLECAQVANGFRELLLGGITNRPAFDEATRAIFEPGGILILAGCAAALLLVDAVASVLWFRPCFDARAREAEGK